MVCFSFLHYTSLCISCDKNLGEFLMLCFVLWTLCCSFLSIKIYVCTWALLLFVNIKYCRVTKMQSLSYLLLGQSLNCEVQFMNSTLDTHYEGVYLIIISIGMSLQYVPCENIRTINIKTYELLFVRINSINNVP
jgi:hypothetical protein